MKTIKTAYNCIYGYLIEVSSKGRFVITLKELRGKFDDERKFITFVDQIEKRNWSSLRK